MGSKVVHDLASKPVNITLASGVTFSTRLTIVRTYDVVLTVVPVIEIIQQIIRLADFPNRLLTF